MNGVLVKEFKDWQSPLTESNNYALLVCAKWTACLLPKEDAFDVWSAFKRRGGDTGDAVALKVNVFQRLRQVGRDV